MLQLQQMVGTTVERSILGLPMGFIIMTARLRTAMVLSSTSICADHRVVERFVCTLPTRLINL